MMALTNNVYFLKGVGDIRSRKDFRDEYEHWKPMQQIFYEIGRHVAVITPEPVDSGVFQMAVNDLLCELLYKINI